MRSIPGPVRLCLAAALAAATGCGNKVAPVINPVFPTGPAGVVGGSYALVLSQPQFQPAASATNPCPLGTPIAGTNQYAGTPYTQPTVATEIDFAGDSVVSEAAIGYGTLTSAISPASDIVYSLNCDGTLNGIPLGGNGPNSAVLQSNTITTTTLFTSTLPGSNTLGAPSIESNMLVQNSAIFTVDKNRDTVGALNAANPPALLQEIPVAPAVVALAGSPTSQRVYAISQGATGSNVSWGQCATAGAVTSNGEADGIDTATDAVSSRIPLGNCPVFGLTTPDGLRTFILNRGSGTVTVINDQQNALDSGFTGNTGQTGTISVGAGPVYAAYYPQRSLLVTANYDSGTVSFINVPIDTFGNDAPGFGTVLALSLIHI